MRRVGFAIDDEEDEKKSDDDAMEALAREPVADEPSAAVAVGSSVDRSPEEGRC